MVNEVARANNGVLGRSPHKAAGSRGKAPGKRVRGRSLAEAEALLVYGRLMKAANLSIFLKFGNANK